MPSPVKHMPIAIPTPRVNNNDDYVRFSQIHREPGSQVRKGDPIAELETDKATVTVEADNDGYVLGFVPPLGEMVAVGSVLAWLGSSADEAMPEAGPEVASSGTASGEPSLKAALLLARYGLKPSDVPATGERLTAQDVLAHVEHRQIRLPSAERGATGTAESPPDITPGRSVPLSVVERGMLKTVTWHRESAVAGYVEIEYLTADWDSHAAAFQKEHQLLMSPLLALMAYRLVQLARESPRVNSTIVGSARHEYESINLGFTVQSGTRLSLVSVRDAGRMNVRTFVDTLGDLMRQGMKGKLSSENTSGITLTFSSMARWQVVRHVPVLPPYSSLIVAHTHARDGVAALGASYDHRVLTGGEVAALLRALGRPDQGEQDA
ncbi:MAG TPA: 2-oxo acid dehydrogenase subunit E2 [Vicinamibacterales bacterium]|nr:2-oxo acid dehydrogenase subunit E2 [Vicinamibacterales bacterium]